MAVTTDVMGGQEMMSGGVLDVWYAAYGASDPYDLESTTDGRLTFNELILTISGTGGTFALKHNRVGGEATAAIDYDASAAEIQAALELLTCVGSGGVVVSGASSPFTIRGAGANKDDRFFDFVVDVANLTGGGATLTRAWRCVGNKKDGVQLGLKGESAEAMTDEASVPNITTILRDGFDIDVKSATKRLELWKVAMGLTDSEITTTAAGASQVAYKELKMPSKPREATYLKMFAYSCVNGLYWYAKGHRMAPKRADATINSTKGAADEFQLPIGYTTTEDESRAAGDRVCSIRQMLAVPTS